MDWTVIPTPEWLEAEAEIDAAGQYLSKRAEEGVGIAFDTETTGLSIWKDIPLLLSLSDGTRRFACWAEHARRPWVADALFRNPNVLKIATNAKFDMHMMANIGIEVMGPTHDTIPMDWLADENRRSHGLKETAKLHCGIKMKDFKEVFEPRKGRTTKKLGTIPGETAGEAIKRTMADPVKRLQAIEYSGLDAFASWKVHELLVYMLRGASMAPVAPGTTLWDHFSLIEVPFTQVLWRLERRGFTLHIGHLLSLLDPMIDVMTNLETQLYMTIGEKININSVQQLQHLFFDKLGRAPIKLTKGGKSGNKSPSTDEEVLSEWAGEGDIISQLILEYRKLAKIKGTYIEGVLDDVDSDNRLHTTLNQSGAVTGRLSSRDPNLQNIPRPNNDVFGIRQAFVAPFGKKLVVLDYDQLEMKLMAHFSGDERMLDAINQGLDLHCYTVFLMYGESYDSVKAAKKAVGLFTEGKGPEPTDDQIRLANLRQAGKSTGFGLIYGIGPKKLGHQLTEELKRLVTQDEAKGLIRKYFQAFPGVERFIKDTHKSCKSALFVQTLVGRLRRLPAIAAQGSDDDDDSRSMQGMAAQARRQAVNSIIQGTAADIAKAAMIRCEFDEELNTLGAQMILQIHDELIFEVDDKPEVIELVTKRAKDIMEHPFGNDYALRIPLTVGGSSAATWASAK